MDAIHPRPASASSSSPVSPPPRSSSERNCLPDQENGYHHSAQLPPNGDSSAPHAAASLPNGATAKRQRKPKDDNATGDAKPKRQRRPRDPNAPPKKRAKKGVAGEEQSAPSPSVVALSHDANIGPSMKTLDHGPFVKQENGHSANEVQRSTSEVRQTHASGQRYDLFSSLFSDNTRSSPAISSPARTTNGMVAMPRPSPAVSNLVVLNGSEVTAVPLAQNGSGNATINSLQHQANSVSSQQTVITTPDASTSQHSSFEVAGKRAVVSSSSLSRVSPPPLTSLAPGPATMMDVVDTKPAVSVPLERPPNDCIVIEVACLQPTGNYVNFLQEVEKKYGFDVAYPRIAEHKRRLAQVAAAGAALESTSGTADEMSLDLSEAESNADAGAVDDDSAAAEDAKKKRRSRFDEYDKNDDFIDDTEQAWEEQALASRDGYFVWSGPLVKPSDNAAVERADGTGRRGRGGRGRGAGRGGASGRAGGSRAARGGNASATNGTSAPARKPRARKADKPAADGDKTDREKPPAVARPSVTQAVATVSAA